MSSSFSADCGRGCPAGQHVLGAVDLGRFAEADGAALAHDDVGGPAQRRDWPSRPHQPSEPPHCSATTSSEAGTSSRRYAAARGSRLCHGSGAGFDRLLQAALVLDHQ